MKPFFDFHLSNLLKIEQFKYIAMQAGLARFTLYPFFTCYLFYGITQRFY